MKQLSRWFIFSALILIMGVSTVKAQITFVAPDTVNNLGAIAPGGLMGIAWGDYDADGDLDFFICGGPTVLYRNDVNETGMFQQVSGAAATDDSIFFDAGGNGTNGGLWADLNGDGKLDLVLGSLRIFLQDDDSLKFNYIGELLPVDLSTGSWNSTAADFDHDGDVDLAITGGVASNAAGPVHIFQNDGDANFTDIGESLIGTFVFESWAPQWVDIDNDTWLDLWVSDIRNTEPCAIFANEMGTSGEMVYLGPGESGIDEQSSIISAWGDYDNDGFLDLYTHTFSGDNTNPARLYKNNGDRTFTDVGPSAGIDSYYVNGTRSISWGDYDNDGWQDLFVSRRDTYTQELYKNNGDGTFTNVGTEAGLLMIGSDIRSSTFVDYDNDGFLDIYIMQNSSNPPRIYHNEGGNGNHWIAFRPKTTVDGNTVAIGARFELYAGGNMQLRYVHQGGPGGTNGFLFPHFGLGSASTVDSVVITWPSGNKEVLTNVTVDQYNDITETIVSVPDDPSSLKTYALMQNYPNPFNPSTTISFNLPERSEVNLVLVDVLGKVVKNIAAGTYDAGLNKVNLDASNLATGVYFYKLQAGQFTNTKKLIVLK